jgi:hypothetical protein
VCRSPIKSSSICLPASFDRPAVGFHRTHLSGIAGTQLRLRYTGNIFTANGRSPSIPQIFICLPFLTNRRNIDAINIWEVPLLWSSLAFHLGCKNLEDTHSHCALEQFEITPRKILKREDVLVRDNLNSHIYNVPVVLEILNGKVGKFSQFVITTLTFKDFFQKKARKKNKKKNKKKFHGFQLNSS